MKKILTILLLLSTFSCSRYYVCSDFKDNILFKTKQFRLGSLIKTDVDIDNNKTKTAFCNPIDKSTYKKLKVKERIY